MKFKSLVAAAALAVAACAGGSVSAATYGTIGPGNDYLNPNVGDTNTLAGYFGGNLYLVGGTADIQVTIIGSEAGYSNSFTFGTPLCTNVASCSYTTGGATSSFPSIVTWDALGVGAGLLNFVFGTDLNGTPGSVTNATNGPNTSTTPNFFVSFLPNPNTTFGQSVLLFLDDGAGGNTDNHDDLIVRLDVINGDGRIAPIPLPAGGLLLIGALGGLAALRRRKSA